jgi:hypothetical protein
MSAKVTSVNDRRVVNLFEVVPRRLLGAICLLLLCGILVAGLWPFRAPRNEVSWSSDGSGLLFGEYGSIVSSGAFKANESKEGAPCSLEIWLQPSLDYSGTFLAYYWTEDIVVPFKLWQSHDYLGIQRADLDQFHRAERTHVYVGDFFRQGKSVIVTISSGPAGTTVYADGLLTKKLPDFRFSSQDLTGQLLLGNAPRGPNPWSGQLKGLAVYDRELTAGEVSEHYGNWTKNTQTDLAKSEGLVALYLFNEGKGSVVHNQMDSKTNLLIPKRFFILHEQFLRPVWNEFFPKTWSYWKDVGINIAGFVPVGFFFCLYFAASGNIKRPLMVTVILGFMISLTIEVLQAFLPTRDSGMTDLITNTSGTALGAMMCLSWFARKEPEQPQHRIKQQLRVPVSKKLIRPGDND